MYFFFQFNRFKDTKFEFVLQFVAVDWCQITFVWPQFYCDWSSCCVDDRHFWWQWQTFKRRIWVLFINLRMLKSETMWQCFHLPTTFTSCVIESLPREFAAMHVNLPSSELVMLRIKIVPSVDMFIWSLDSIVLLLNWVKTSYNRLLRLINLKWFFWINLTHKPPIQWLVIQ